MLKRKKRIIAKVMATTMLATTLASTFAVEANAQEPRASVTSSKISGDDRYKTAVEISKNYSSTSKHAVVVNGQKGIVDELTATPYASLKNAPILMTENNKLNADTKKELTRRGIKTVDIIGGTASVSDAVKSEIQAMGITVNRIAGNSKYETSLKVAKEFDKISDISKIAVANGEVLADAVSVAAPAAQNKMPIILAHPKNGLDADTKAYINGEGINTSYVIGGTSSVSNTTQNSLPGTKKRLQGTGRQETNAEVVEEFYKSSTYDNIYVTKSGQVNKADEIADALAVGVLAAYNQDPVMIVGKSLSNDQKVLLEGKKFTKITEVGNGIPTASIQAIKDTQKDPEAQVSGVTLVNYKTIKITGRELNRIDKSKVSISGNTTVSYTANSTGTEATVEFANAFSNGTNTVRVTSNLGNTTSHSFTYNSEISSVEATTKEVATSGIQYLGFTVNGGQTRSVEELKSLGWTVEFKSSKEVFYNTDNPTSPLKTSKTGKLKTTGFVKDEIFDYEITLTKGSQVIKTTDKKLVTVTDKTNDIASIKSYEAAFNNRAGENNDFVSNKLLVGESVTLKNIKGLRNDGKEANITDDVTLKSSDPTVLVVSDKNITARKVGTAKVTISNGTVSKEISIQVLDAEKNAREVRTVRYYVGDTNKTSITLTKNQSNATVKVKAVDQHGDPINSGAALEKSTINTSSTPTEENKIGAVSVGDFANGEATMTISPDTGKVGTGTVKMQKTVAGKKIDLGSLSVTIRDAVADRYTYKLEHTEANKDMTLDRYDYKDDNSLALKLNTYDSNGNLMNQTNINGDDYVVKVNDSELVTATKNASGIDIVPTANKTKTGSTTVYLYKKDSNNRETLLTSVSISIVDATPVIKSINTNTINTITKVNSDAEFDLLKLFNINYTAIDNDAGSNISDEAKYKKVVEGISVQGYPNAEVILSLSNKNAGGSESGIEAILFIDRNNNGVYNAPGGSDKGDFVLGTIRIETSGINATVTNGKVKLDADTPNGSIIVALYDGVYAANKTPKDTVINVNITR